MGWAEWELIATLRTVKSEVTKACINAKKAVATKISWRNAAERPVAIQAASPRSAPISGTTPWTMATASARTSAK